MTRRVAFRLSLMLLAGMVLGHAFIPLQVSRAADGAITPLSSRTRESSDRSLTTSATTVIDAQIPSPHAAPAVDYWSLLFVLGLSTLLGLGVIVKVSRLLHTPLMSLTNAISAIAVVGAIIVTGGDHPVGIRILGFIALFASMTNIVSGFLITDRMLKMFKQPSKDAKP